MGLKHLNRTIFMLSSLKHKSLQISIIISFDLPCGFVGPSFEPSHKGMLLS